MGGFVWHNGIFALMKTVWFNFRYLPFRQAVRMPVFLSRRVNVYRCHRGFYMGGGRTGDLRFLDNGKYTYHKPSMLNIRGKIVTRGEGIHLFGSGLTLSIGEKGVLELGNNVTVSFNATFCVHNRVVIGDENMWSHDIVIRDNDSHMIFDRSGKFINGNKPIVIGNRVWVGCRSIILKGCTIADGTIVGAGSVLTKPHTEQDTVIVDDGRVVKRGVSWVRTTTEFTD